jgi:hypothetical protein
MSHQLTATAPVRPPNKLKRTSSLGLLAVLALGVAGCGASGTWVYVDNTGDEPLVVTVDGQEAATVAPGEFTKLVFEPGQKQFHVRCGQEVLFDGVKVLQPSDKLGVSRRYFFNPRDDRRYVTYTVKYGSSAIEELVQSAVEKAGDHDAAIKYAYQKLANEVQPQPAASWFEVPQGALVLTQPPSFVTSRGGIAERRVVMTRVSREDYEVLVAARGKTNPTEEDLDALDELIDRVTDD